MRQTHINTRYRPLWDVTIASRPQCPVWCCLYSRLQFIGESDTETPKVVALYFWSWIWWQILNREALILLEFPCNNTSISLIFGDTREWQTDGWTDNVDRYYSSPHIVPDDHINANHLYDIMGADDKENNLQIDWLIEQRFNVPLDTL